MAGTPVQIATGDASHPVAAVLIENLKPGDPVVSRDENTGKTSARRVLQTTKRFVTDIVKVELVASVTGDVVETLRATPEHPVYVQGKGWVELGQLGIGTQIVSRAGPALVVKSVIRLGYPEGVAVYNLSVENDHSYFIGNGNGGAWVHNACNPQANRAAGKEWEETLLKRYQAGGLDAYRPAGVKTSIGWRFPDIAIRDAEGNIVQYIEAKVGSSKYLPSQQAKDQLIQTVLGISTRVSRKP